MKKILLLIVMSIMFLTLINAQLIDIEGRGVIGENQTATLTLSDLSDINYVIFEAAAVIQTGSNATDPGPVVFTNNKNGEEIEAQFNTVEIHAATTSNPQSGRHKGYYSVLIDGDDIDGSGITLDKTNSGDLTNRDGLEPGDGVMSFYAYIVRENSSPELYSILHPDMDRAFIYHNGLSGAVEYEFTLSEYEGTRDIEVTVPFSDNELEGERVASITLSDGNGDVSNDEFLLSNAGDNLTLETLTLTDVPGNVTSIKVEIYSPNNQDGDSFIVGVPVLTVEEKPGDEPDPGCTLTQGYWKNHVTGKKHDPTWDELPNGSDTEFFNSGQNYLEVLNTPVKGNAYYILAHQYIAAELNMLAGADDSDIATEFVQATSWFNSYGPDDVTESNKDMLTGWASLFDDYNNGLIGPGHCDEMDNDDTEQEVYEQVEAKVKTNNGKAKGKNKSAEISAGNSLQSIADLLVYPNPVAQSATISFTTVLDGNVTVDLYNSLGQLTSKLMDRSVVKDLPVNISINSQDYNEGLYILRVQNESSVGTTRISIGR